MDNKYRLNELKKMLKEDRPKDASKKFWARRQRSVKAEIEKIESGKSEPVLRTPKSQINKFWDGDQRRPSLGTSWSPDSTKKPFLPFNEWKAKMIKEGKWID